MIYNMLLDFTLKNIISKFVSSNWLIHNVVLDWKIGNIINQLVRNVPDKTKTWKRLIQQQ